MGLASAIFAAVDGSAATRSIADLAADPSGSTGWNVTVLASRHAGEGMARDSMTFPSTAVRSTRTVSPTTSTFTTSDTVQAPRRADTKPSAALTAGVACPKATSSGLATSFWTISGGPGLLS